ncbi:hypothetical protein Bca52824_001214 [Brassica carinata]|uniref:TF-B3 domain-containing protein n=1 Tax=Brassica carinata TaxID=52824 RepID=A0A8X7WHW7_BRACI|nr:hypothetical protein Bca52824_001214 [Brassica carinata]
MVERGEDMGCVGEDMGRGSLIPSHSLQFRRSLSPPTRAAGREQRREYMVVRVRRMVLKDSLQEMFPQWPNERQDPQVDRLITDIHTGTFVKGLWEVQGNAQGKGNEKKNKETKGGVSSEAEPPTKKQKKVNTSEGQAGATGKGSSEEPSKELLNNATMESIVSAVGKMIDSRFNAYGFDQNKTLEDIVKDTLEERLKVLGVGKHNENIDNLSIASGEEGSLEKPSPQQDKHQKSVNSPALNPAKPGKGLGPEKHFAEEVDNASGVKKILAGDFDRANATPVKTSKVDFVFVSPAKTCKDDKVANCPPLRRGTRIRQGLKLKDEDEAEDAAAKKKAAKAEAYLMKKEMGFALTAVDSSEPSGPVFPFIDNDGTMCMRKNIEPSTAKYDPCAPVDPSLYEKLMKHISSIPPKKPGPAGKKVVRSADHESDFYSILIHERPWPDSEYGWVFDNTIPHRFFSTHIEGKTNQKTWKLRSDASHQTWEVIQEGRRLTGGWKDFTTAHDLRIGDIVIFKHEGDMVFHVTPFGPSCCEIQYTHPNIIKEEADADDAPSFSFDYCLLAEVTASNLKEDKFYLSVEATTCTALNKQCQEIILVNKERNS